MRMTYFGHSAFGVEAAGKTTLLDPFLTGNPMCPEGTEAGLEAVDFIVLTHGHPDHVGDTVALAKKHGATIVAIFELCQWLGSQGAERCVPMNMGGTVSFDGLSFSLVNAVHSSSNLNEDGSPVYLGQCGGFVVKAEGHSIYHAGDTDVFSDMTLIHKVHQPTVGLIPMGGHFTMSAAGAALACNELMEFEVVVPMHWGTFPVLAPDPSEFAGLVKRGRVEVLQPGESLEL